MKAVVAGAAVDRTDRLVAEEPLEIRIGIPGGARTLTITMRTPGADFELAVGLLFSEGIVSEPDDVARIAYCDTGAPEGEQLYNVVTVDLARPPRRNLSIFDRNFITSSACGVCGSASIEALELKGFSHVAEGPEVSVETLTSLPERLARAQAVFKATGGLHAAGLFDRKGSPVALREDVGRHNAVDKLIGWGLLNRHLPFDDHLVLVSGRSSFEIVQKCVAAGVTILCSISAPSSLAVSTAETFGVTLVGFLRDDRFNVYSGAHRIEGLASA